MYCVTSLFKYRLTSHLSCNNLCNPHQSALCKYHSTETALLYIHDHLINAIGSQQVHLCFVDLSTAFYTIDHTSYSPVCLLALKFMALFLTGLHLTCHPTFFV